MEDDYHTGLARYGLNFTVLEIGIALMLVPFGERDRKSHGEIKD
jgi:hypothetical protein